MINHHYVIKYQFIQNAMRLKLLSYDYRFIINIRILLAGNLIMFSGTYENQTQLFGEKGFGMLQKSQLINNLTSTAGFHASNVENNFQEVFLTNFPPKFSTLSNCTQSDRTYESFSIADDFMGDSVDCFLVENPLKNKTDELSGAKKLESLPIVTDKNNNIFIAQVEGESDSKQIQTKNCHDETKNIPKNYIKAIFTFILQNKDYIHKLFQQMSLNSQDNQVIRFLQFVMEQKKIKKYTIERLKSLWMNPQNGKTMRIISCQFLRKRSLSYILGSKIEKKLSHIKHRYKFIKSIENPAEFTNIK